MDYGHQSVLGVMYNGVRHAKLNKPYLLPPWVTQESFDDALSYQPQPGDVFVATYPKCGTTWISYMLNLLRNGGTLLEGEYLTNGYKYAGVVPCLEFGRKATVENIDKALRVIKTHLYKDLCPWSEKAKYIVIARNPKDCINSYYYHFLELCRFQHKPACTFDEYFEVIIKGEAEYGYYFKHVPEWWEKSKEEANVLFVLYEDIWENTEREFLRICEFIGGEWGKKLKANDSELLKSIVQDSRLEKMMEAKDTISDVGHSLFLRKGVVGDWKTNFSEAQSKRVDEKLQEAAVDFPGFDKLWDRYSAHFTC